MFKFPLALSTWCSARARGHLAEGNQRGPCRLPHGALLVQAPPPTGGAHPLSDFALAAEPFLKLGRRLFTRCVNFSFACLHTSVCPSGQEGGPKIHYR